MKEVLIIEDNTMDQILNRSILESLGFNCTVVADGEQAINFIKSVHFDLIVLDYHLPKLNGLQFVMGYKNAMPVANTPVVVVSANENTDVEKLMKSFGVKAFIRKPLEIGAHGNLIKHLMGS